MIFHVSLKQLHVQSTAVLFVFLAQTVTPADAAPPVSDLVSALNAAAPGDVIRVKPVDLGTVSLSNYAFSPAVTTEFHKNANIRRVTLRNVSGVIFDGMQVDAGESFNPNSENAVLILGGGDITIRNADFQWAQDDNPLNDGTALVFDGVDGLSVEASTFHDVLNGVIIRSSADATVQGSQFTNIFSDGIIVSGTQNVLIDNNSCADFTSALGVNTHPDCIQLQAGGRAVANTNSTISNNTILKGSGARAQGIFVDSRHVGVPHIGVTIENNLIKQDVGLGIFASNITDLIIHGNDVLPSFNAEESPRIVVREPADNVLIEANTAAAITAPPDAILIDNTILD